MRSFWIPSLASHTYVGLQEHYWVIPAVRFISTNHAPERPQHGFPEALATERCGWFSLKVMRAVEETSQSVGAQENNVVVTRL